MPLTHAGVAGGGGWTGQGPNSVAGNLRYCSNQDHAHCYNPGMLQQLSDLIMK